MKTLFAAMLGAAILLGTFADRPDHHAPISLDGFRVLAVDLHTHGSMWSDGNLTPFGIVLEARRQGLDAVAVTGHNTVNDSFMAQWFSRLVGGPTVLNGEEIAMPRHHVIAVGITQTVSWRGSVAEQADEIHRQGGIAIAAHPGIEFGAGFDAAAIARLDGSEICHPMIFGRDGAQAELERFAARGSMAAIGSSDFHGTGPLGRCRTYVFAEANTQASIVDAIRKHRTVVYGRGGKAYGDPALIAIAERDGRLRSAAPSIARNSWTERAAELAGVVGLIGLIL